MYAFYKSISTPTESGIMTNYPTNPDQRVIDAFSTIVEQVGIKDGNFGETNDYMSSAIWYSASGNLVVMCIVDDAIVINGTYLPGEIRAIGLRDNHFKGDIEGIPVMRQFIVDTPDELVELAYRFIAGLDA